MSKDSIAATVITLVLLIACAMPLLATPVQAQIAAQQPVAGPLPSGANPDFTVTTEPQLSIRPNPVGVGQSILINIWLHPPINVQRQFVKAFSVTFTKPDGTKETIGPIDSFQGDSTAWFEYVVDQLGTWKAKFDFAGMWFPAGRYYMGQIVTNTSGQTMGSAYYKPSSTPEVAFTAQEEQIWSWPMSPLPTDYWTQPVNPINREWWPILGSYPPTGIVGGSTNWPANTNKYASNYNFVPYIQGPESSHIAWKRQLNIGGLIGGTAGQVTNTQPVNPVRGYPTIIYAGRVYDVYTKPGVNKTAQSYWRCCDVRTGELFWERPLETGETEPNIVEYAAQGEEVPGASARASRTVYLTAITGPSGSNSGRVLKYDPYTGNLLVNVSGASSGMSAGELYANPYVLSVQRIGSSYRLINWTIDNNAGVWVAGAGNVITDNFTLRIKSNISWPFSSLGTCDYEAGVAVTTTGISSSATGTAIGQGIMAASLTTGQLLWNTTTDLTTGLETFFSAGLGLADHGKYAVRMQNGQWYCWDLFSGTIVWKSALSAWPWGVFGAYSTVSAYGLIYSYDYDGVHAIDWETGKIVWNFISPAPYPYETPYQGNYSWHGAAKAADGKLYVYNGEHTPSQPVTRGWRLYCLNATTGEHFWDIPIGELIWNTIWFGLGGIPGSRIFQGAIGEGYLLHTNEYDGYLYAFGKGKSATTVTAPDVLVSKGSGVVIKGTVLDLSPAQPGTPCVSKESMNTQMEYLHMQYPIDGIAHNITMTGVPVLLTAIDQNGQSNDIGTATTSAYYGTYEMAWTPTAEGTYKIIASFAGDDSYGSSGAATAVTVGPAPAQITIPEQAQPFDYTMTIIGGVIAVVVAVALVGVILYRKK